MPTTTLRRLLAGVLVAVAVLAGATYAAARALGDDGLPERQLINQGRPANAPGANLQLVRVTIPPGGVIAKHTHPGMQIILIESGSIAYTVVKGRIRIRRAPQSDGTPGATEIVEAGQTVDDQRRRQLHRDPRDGPRGRQRQHGCGGDSRELALPEGSAREHSRFEAPLTSVRRVFVARGCRSHRAPELRTRPW